MDPTHRVEPRGLSGGKGQSPGVVRMCKHIRLSGHWNYRPSSRASTAHADDDVPMTSSDDAPRSHHPATLRVRFAMGPMSMPQESGMIEPIASLLNPLGVARGRGSPLAAVGRKWGSIGGSQKGSKMGGFRVPDGGQGKWRKCENPEFSPRAPRGPKFPPARPPGPGAPPGGVRGVPKGCSMGSKWVPIAPPKTVVLGLPCT